MTWVAGKNGKVSEGAKAGHWTYGNWRTYKDTVTGIPSWEDTEQTVLDICPFGYQIRNVTGYGGIDLRWNTHQTRQSVTAKRRRKNRPNAPEITQNNVPVTKVHWTVWTKPYPTRP